MPPETARKTPTCMAGMVAPAGSSGTGSGSTTWGSMVHAEGRLYVLMRNGATLVFAASPKYQVLANNSLGGEETNSSLAIRRCVCLAGLPHCMHIARVLVISSATANNSGIG